MGLLARNLIVVTADCGGGRDRPRWTGIPNWADSCAFFTRMWSMFWIAGFVTVASVRRTSRHQRAESRGARQCDARIGGFSDGR